ncbi:MAG TPA: hypothetical protein VGQ08_00305 [Nitrospiraceae bacterium]|jgi:hypothetical protein|nr:hypothetical protein [Nitrospiraceae bacterium]
MLNLNAQQWVDTLRSVKMDKGSGFYTAAISFADGSTKTFHFVQKFVRRPHVQTRLDRVEFFGVGGA